MDDFIVLGRSGSRELICSRASGIRLDRTDLTAIDIRLRITLIKNVDQFQAEIVVVGNERPLPERRNTHIPNRAAGFVE
jgi:hypothetical protein